MKLRQKALALVALTLAILTALVSVATWVVQYRSLEESERLMVEQEVRRGALALQNELNFLSNQVWEYSSWDDTCTFVQNGNPAYIRSNLADSVFAGGRRNVIIIMNRAGQIIYGSGFDLAANHKQPLPRGMFPYLKAGTPLTTHRDIKSKAEGVLILPEGPMLIVSRPILSSQETGPSPGTMIMGRFFTTKEMERLAEMAHQKIGFYPIGAPALPPGLSQNLISAKQKEAINVKPVDRNEVAGYELIRDIFGKPVLIMQVKVPRIIYQQEEQNIHFLLAGIIFIGVTLGLFVLWLLERLVLSRLLRMSEEVSHIGISGDPLKRVSVTGRDELASLAGSINGMLETIETSREVIREESDRYRAVVEDQTELICRFGLKEKLIFANEALGRYLDRPVDELLGRSFFELFPWDNIAEIKSDIYTLDRGQPVRMVDAKLLFPDDRTQWTRWTVRVIFSAEGEPREYQAVGRDITARMRVEAEKKAIETQLYQAQKMEAIGTLAGGIAHDFNNILMGIGGYVSLMLYDIDMNHPHYRKLKAIEDQVKSAAALTKDLLGFARGGAYEMRPTDLNRILGMTGSIFGRSRKDIEIRQRFEPLLWNINADRGQMEQVFMNLFVNAEQAMPAGGHLYLETQNITVESRQDGFIKPNPGPYVQISVTDEGVGMDEETKERIFEPFFTTRDRNKRGSGLGLASVYGIIKNHGGMINVYTEKGVGTTFRLYLPAIDSSVVSKLEPELGKPHLLQGTEGILVVEDEAILVDVTLRMLNLLGYQVYIARNGEEALETYGEKRDQIDLVLLDMIMPGMSGEETFRQLKEINPEIKVILASGYSLNEQATRIMENGCRAFLQKPFNAAELSHTLRDVLDQLF